MIRPRTLPNLVYIAHFIVKEEWRKNGVGSKLWDAMRAMNPDCDVALNCSEIPLHSMARSRADNGAGLRGEIRHEIPTRLASGAVHCLQVRTRYGRQSKIAE